jgi:hypothetical protein
MNPLQSGTPASAITPQGYRNSTQSGNFQSGISGSELLESSSATYTMQVNPKLTLSVKSNNSRQVLSASTNTATQNSVSADPTNNYVPIALVVLVVSVGLAVYFIRKFKSFAPIDEDE